MSISEFFRDLEFFKYLRESLIAELYSFPLIKVWSVGCANGQEAYSLAIVLKESGLLHRSLIYATDIDEESLKTAKVGRFTKDDFIRGMENYYLSGGNERFSLYFNEDGESFKIIDELKDRIYFEKHNVVKDGIFNEFNLIICKNLLYYLSKIDRDFAFINLQNSLSNFGYLAVDEYILDFEGRGSNLIKKYENILKKVEIPPL